MILIVSCFVGFPILCLACVLFVYLLKKKYTNSKVMSDPFVSAQVGVVNAAVSMESDTVENHDEDKKSPVEP